MNEISILMHLLSRKSGKYQIGASKKEILDMLNITHKNKELYFQELIINLSKYIEPLGLQIRFNPINSNWYISHDSQITDLTSANPFENKPRLAASLFCALVLSINNPTGIVKVSEIQEIRKKKTIYEDLDELEKLGYLEVDKKLEQIKLTPLLGYHLDLDKLFINLALKIKD
jgi:hypothetical protein